MTPRLSLLKSCSGSAAVEFVLILPLLLVLVFTTLEGGQYLYLEHKVVKAVRNGSRYAARQPFAKFTCPTTIDSTVATNIKRLVRTGYVSGDNPNISGTDNPVIGGWVDGDVTVTLTCDGATTTGLYANTTGGAPRVKVNAVVSYPSLFLILGFQAAANAKLQAMSQAAVTGL